MNVLQTIKDLRKTSRSATEAATAGLDQIRGRLVELEAEAAEIEAMPAPRDVILAAFDRDLARFTGEATRTFQIANLTRTPKPGLRLPSVEAAVWLLVAANAEAFRSFVISLIDKDLDGADLPDLKERAARLEKIAEERDELVRAEEAVIREMEAAGLPVLRRADADPDALLLSDTALGLG